MLSQPRRSPTQPSHHLLLPEQYNNIGDQEIHIPPGKQTYYAAIR